MITIFQGSPVTVNVPAGSSLSVNTDGYLLVEVVSGLGVTAGTLASNVYGSRVFGPWESAGVVKLTATLRNGSYDVAAITPSALLITQSGVSVGIGESSKLANLNIAHPRYWFHGCATLQGGDDGVFRDMVAGNNGTFGANLSRSQAWANRDKGYISTIDPTGGSTDSVIRIPGPNWDYANGQSLLILWSGQVTPEGSDADLMGTSNGTSYNGIRVRANSDGRLAFVLYDTTPTSAFSTTSTNNAAGKPFVSGELHSFALFIDGQNRQQSFWVDNDINVSPLALSSGVSVNTLSSATWNIGTAAPVGGTIGVATKTLAFAGLKFLATDQLPTTAQITAVVQAFNRDPRGLILAGAL